MGKQNRTRFPGVVAAVLLGVVSAACANSTATTITEKSTITAVPEGTTTTAANQETTSTTTTKSPQPKLVDDSGIQADIAVLEEQAHDVIVEFSERINRLGQNSGRVPLQAGDPFGGAVRQTLAVADSLHEWMVLCAEVGACGGRFAPAEVGGVVSVVATAGEHEITPLGDSTFYVAGAYAQTRGESAGYAYLSGFRFEVRDGKAVLVDAASWPSVESAKAIWLSELAEVGQGRAQVQTPTQGVKARVVGTSFHGWASPHTKMWVAIEVTAEGRDLSLSGENIRAEGPGADVYNAAREESLAIGGYVNGVWGRLVPDGGTRTLLISTTVPEGLSTRFLLPLEDGNSGEVVIELVVISSDVKYCDVLHRQAALSCGALSSLTD